jgi:hypothetical protein
LFMPKLNRAKSGPKRILPKLFVWGLGGNHRRKRRVSLQSTWIATSYTELFGTARLEVSSFLPPFLAWNPVLVWMCRKQ